VIKRLAILIWSTMVWIALWEDLSWANLVGGLIVAAGVSTLIPPRPRRGPPLGFRPLNAVWLAAYFLWKLVEASAYLAWEVVTPRNRVNPAVVSVRLTTSSPAIATLVAQLVSLTPGTLTLEIDEATKTLYAHVLHLDSVGEARRDVLAFERLALRAFPERGPARVTGGAP
jgi:multicomponent Na+:H+ antiporter subunit E